MHSASKCQLKVKSITCYYFCSMIFFSVFFYSCCCIYLLILLLLFIHSCVIIVIYCCIYDDDDVVIYMAQVICKHSFMNPLWRKLWLLTTKKRVTTQYTHIHSKEMQWAQLHFIFYRGLSISHWGCFYCRMYIVHSCFL